MIAKFRDRFGYSPVRSRTWLVFLTHPFEIGLGAILPALAVLSLFTEVSASLASLPPALLYLYSTISGVGGILLLVGLFWHDPPRQIGFGVALERASLFLVAVSYAVRGIVVISVNGAGGIGFGAIAIGLAVVCFLRTVAIRRASTIVMEAVEENARRRVEGTTS